MKKIILVFLLSFSFSFANKNLETYLSKEVASQKTSNEIYKGIMAASKEFNVDPLLIAAIIKVESNFKPTVVSPGGAIGLMQLQPRTAKYLGVNPRNIRDNIKGGTRYISECIKKNKGSITIGLAAYNAGQGNVNKYKGIPPFKTTKNHINKVMTIYRNIGGKS